MKNYNPSAFGSDKSRTLKQLLCRKFASVFVSMFRLNSGNFLSTEIIQKINPVHKIKTKKGDLLCRGGHGRLRWRAETFYTEEPETIKWLNSFKEDDYFWDIGANVGLYSVYAAKVTNCKVMAFEPEAQNYASLLENILLNNLQKSIEATNIPVTSKLGLGKLKVHALTKGGAYNQFCFNSQKEEEALSSSINQVQLGISLDALISQYGFSCPTHIKIDVDGNEPMIIAGASSILSNPKCKTVLIEIQKNLPEHMEIIKKMNKSGYKIISQRSNWDSREHRKGEEEYPTVNIIFSK